MVLCSLSHHHHINKTNPNTINAIEHMDISAGESAEYAIILLFLFKA